jgi:hypothetical protein
MLGYLPMLGALLGAWACSVPSRSRLLQESIGGGIGAAFGLLLTNTLWHFLWRTHELDFGWQYPPLGGLAIHALASFAGLAMTFFAIGLLLGAFRYRQVMRRVSPWLGAACWGILVGWPIAYGRLLVEPLYFYHGYLMLVPWLAWLPGELVHSAYQCFGIALVVTPVAWGIDRILARSRTAAAIEAANQSAWDAWDLGLSRRKGPTILLPPPSPNP